MSERKTRGKFIVFEGPDKAGKTTQCNRLCEHLKTAEIPFAKFSFPDRTTTIGAVIDRQLRASGLHIHPKAVTLLFSANRWEHADKIRELLESGVNIVCDRYSYSGVVYAIAAHKDYSSAENEFGLPAPDAVHCIVFEDEKDQTARWESSKDKIRETTETPAIQAKVNKEFKSMGDSHWVFHNAAMNADDIHKKICDHVHALLTNADSEIDSLTRANFWEANK